MQLVDALRAAFISGAVSISAASRSAGNEPALSRANGCRVSPDRRTVTLLFAQSRAAGFLDAVRETGVVAAVFSRASTHETIQLKAVDARLVPLEAGDADLARAYVERLVAELAALGYGAATIRNLLWHVPEDLVGVRFSPCFAFDQTPGPRAGAPLPHAA